MAEIIMVWGGHSSHNLEDTLLRMAEIFVRQSPACLCSSISSSTGIVLSHQISMQPLVDRAAFIQMPLGRTLILL